jgi:iron complex transport system substrate-binding protein
MSAGIFRSRLPKRHGTRAESIESPVVMRLVTLTCSNTEIVAALGMGHDIVGVDDHSDFPDDLVSRAARVGPDLGVDPAKVAALKPDLVLASLTVPGHERVVDRLLAAGLPVRVYAPVSVEDVLLNIREIAEVLGVSDRGEALAGRMRAALTPSPAVEPRPRILVEWWPKPVIVPGHFSWVHQLLELAGAENPLGQRDVTSAPITDDEARELRPDAVVISWCGVRLEKYRPDVVYRRPAWRDLPALRNGRVYSISEALLGRPGPRIVEGYRALREIVEAFRSEDSVQEARRG